jgi:hypothetical protein
MVTVQRSDMNMAAAAAQTCRAVSNASVAAAQGVGGGLRLQLIDSSSWARQC